jgi:threonylcarbamoyladenosine tRNA methylthiotransferase MtaB
MKLSEDLVSDGEDTIIINTCSVTREAERQSKQIVRKAIRENIGAKIIVTGCAAKTARDYFENLSGVAKVVQNEDKGDMDISKLQTGQSHYLFESRARAFLQIQNGCDHFCSYCIVPITRGRSKSVPPDFILKHIDYFVDRGFNEIVLSGIDITSYGKDSSDLSEPYDLHVILEKVLERTHLYKTRLRLSSIDPAAVNQNLLNLFLFEPRMMPYFHFSIQSGNNEVLKVMRRRHSREDVIELCSQIRKNRNQSVIGGDLIVGFPTETDAMFDDSLNLVDDAGLSLIHVFPYSARNGTLAAQMINLPATIIRERAAKLKEKANFAKTSLLRTLIGTTISGLIEKRDHTVSIGKSDSYLPFRVNHPFRSGEVVHDLKVIDVNQDELVAESNNV